jgi:hypothetical protein
MAVKTISILKKYFETGDRPTQAQFGDFIDSVIHKNTGAVVTDKAQNPETGAYSIDLSDGTSFSFNIPTSAGISFIDNLQSALDNRVVKVDGKSLSQNDYNTAEKAKVTTAAGHVADDAPHVSDAERLEWNGKVDAVEGKGLSTNDFDATDAANLEAARVHGANYNAHVTAPQKTYFGNKLKNWVVETITDDHGLGVFRLFQNALYQYVSAVRPFDTVDIETEAAAGKWDKILGGLGYVRIQNFSERGSVSGEVDGQNKDYSLTDAYVPETLEVLLNGIDQTLGDDYTETDPVNGLFSFIDAPIVFSGDKDKIIVRYQKF